MAHCPAIAEPRPLHMPPRQKTRAHARTIFSEKTRLMLLPIDVKEAWSDQIVDIEANGMPDKTGNANKAYILMGVRADGKAHGKLRLGSAIPEGLRTKFLWRFQKKSGGTPEAGSSTYEQDGTIVRITMDSPANADDKDYVVVVGFDSNSTLLQPRAVGSDALIPNFGGLLRWLFCDCGAFEQCCQ